MSLLLDEDQQMLREAAHNFCQQQTPISQLRRLRDSRDELGFDQASWRQMVELGWAGMTIEEKYGGFGFGYGGLGLVLEETGRTLTSSPLIASILLGATVIDRLSDPDMRRTLLPRLAKGELLLALALDEGAHHNPRRIRTRALKTGNGYELSGSKTFVLDGHIADQILVVARTDGEEDSADGISVFLVPAESPGLSRTRTLMVDSRNAARLELERVTLPAAALVGDEGQAFASLEEALDIARIGIAAEMLGSMEETFARIIDYLNQRQQFGVPIGAFQALQHRAAIMYSEIQLCRSSVRAGLEALDAGQGVQDIARLASLAKAKLSEVSSLVSDEGIQMHGGIGMTDEFDIGFFIKRARVASQFLGDAAYHRRRYAELCGF